MTQGPSSAISFGVEVIFWRLFCDYSSIEFIMEWFGLGFKTISFPLLPRVGQIPLEGSVEKPEFCKNPQSGTHEGCPASRDVPD